MLNFHDGAAVDGASRPPPHMTAPAQEIPFSAELSRKALHLLALVVPLGMALLGRTYALWVLVPLALLALAADVLRTRSAGFAGFVQRWFGWMMRAEELPPVGGPLRLNGATWVLVSAALLAALFPLRIAVPCFVMFMVSDAAAALVGRRIGRIRWAGTRRTVEGSLAFLAVGLGIMAGFTSSVYPGLVFWMAAVATLLGCLAEALPGPFNDNLRVPLVAATTLFVLERLAAGGPM